MFGTSTLADQYTDHTSDKTGKIFAKDKSHDNNDFCLCIKTNVYINQKLLKYILQALPSRGNLY